MDVFCLLDFDIIIIRLTNVHFHKAREGKAEGSKKCIKFSILTQIKLSRYYYQAKKTINTIIQNI